MILRTMGKREFSASSIFASRNLLSDDGSVIKRNDAGIINNTTAADYICKQRCAFFPPQSMSRFLSSSSQSSEAANLTKKAVLMDSEELREKLNKFQDLFVEARLCIEDARDSADTTDFDEEAELAKDAVDEAISAFNKLVSELDDLDQKNSVLRSNGLKAEQLKGELQLVLTGGH